jgi:AcrR family transcriptional regulator
VTGNPHRGGRPRDATIDERVVQATRALLVERGFEATTVQAIAERAGVHASAIYRRWPSRTKIIEHVVFPGFASMSVAPTGDLRRDLRRFVRAYVTTLGAPAAVAAIPGLLATYQATDDAGSPEGWLPVSARPQFVDIVRAAPAGAVDPAVDVDDVFDVLLGAVIARTLIPTVARRNRPIERLVDQTLRLLQPSVAAARPAPGAARARVRPPRGHALR